MSYYLTEFSEDRDFFRPKEKIKSPLRSVAVLIGYQYHSKKLDSNCSTILPGILIDLYQAYTFAVKSSPTEIVVITDIEQDQMWRETIGAMGKHIVDSGILDFIIRIKNKGIYHRHVNKKWFTESLTNVFSRADRVIFYYTGHGKDGYLELPSIAESIVNYEFPSASEVVQELTITILGETEPRSIRPTKSQIISSSIDTSSEFIKMSQIRKICFQQANPEVEALFIFDSCNSTGLGMPFKLRPDGVFRLVDYIPRDILSYQSKPVSYQISKSGGNISQLIPLKSDRLGDIYPEDYQDEISSNSLIQESILSQKRKFFKAKAICISSTAPRQKSLSTSDGSLFTRHLFESIMNGEKSLLKIKKILEVRCSSFSQTASVYSTYPDLRFLWKWLYGGEIRYRTKLDVHHGLVILTEWDAKSPVPTKSTN